MIFTCMGGWCGQRDKCAHFHATPLKHFAPAERLCGKRERPVLIKQKDREPITLPDPFCQAPLNPVATIPAPWSQNGGFTQVATAHIVAAY